MKHTKLIVGAISAVLTFGSASVALALSPTDYTLFGDAQYITPGNGSARAVEIQSDATAPGYGGIDFGIAPTFLNVTGLGNLSTDYRFTNGSCGGGAPRFEVAVQTPTNGVKNIFVYIGAPPNYTNCPQNVWLNTGNLVLPTSLVDATQLGGTFYEPYAQVMANYGSYPIVGISLVTDASWAFPTGQSVDIDNTQINATTYTYEVPPPPVPTNQAQCKNGGYKNFTDNQGHSFKNQGDCVSYVSTGGKNKGAGN